MSLGKGTHKFKTPLQIVYDEPAKKSAEFLADYLNRFYNVNSKLTLSSSSGRDANYITLVTGATSRKGEYELKIDKRLSISGDEEGVFYGVQTLIQMLPPHVSNNQIELPYVTIKDYPRFGYRGMHLDCGPQFYVN
jgi:hexosaminidase